MSSHDWHVVASFGLLAGALTLVDPSFALKVVSLAALVVVVTHPSTVEHLLGKGN